MREEKACVRAVSGFWPNVLVAPDIREPLLGVTAACSSCHGDRTSQGPLLLLCTDPHLSVMYQHLGKKRLGVPIDYQHTHG